MLPSTTISSKGQITVPIEIRKRLGVKAGDRVHFVIEDGNAILRLTKTDKNPFEQFAGCLPAFKTAEENIAYWRDLRDPEGEYM